MVQLFRVLLPSWKFFDGVVDAPELFYRAVEPMKTDWTLCIPKTGKRSWKKLWINERENFLFASHALIEYLRDDFADGSDPSTSLELVKNLVQFQMHEQGINPKKFQFMLASTTDENDAEYVSPVLEMTP